MNIALVQSHIIWENKDKNIAVLEQVITDNPDVDAFFLPEMSFTGFSMNTSVTTDRNRETQNQMRKIALDHNVCLGFGWVRPAGEKCSNVYSVIDKEGNVVSEFNKIHPFSFSGEDRYFTGGDTVSVYDLCGIPFSTFICYDLRFPESFRKVCDKVHAIVIPANWPAKRSEHWKTLLRARAIENQLYIFAVNCVGDINGVSYSGDSCVVNPNGDVIEMLSGQEGVIRYDFTDDVEKYRNAFPVLQDRVAKFSV